MRLQIQNLNSIGLLFLILGPSFFSVLIGLVGLEVPASMVSLSVAIVILIIIFIAKRFMIRIRFNGISQVFFVLFLLVVSFSYSYSASLSFKDDKLFWFSGLVVFPVFIIIMYSLFYRVDYDRALFHRHAVISSLLVLLVFTTVAIINPLKDVSGRLAITGLENTIYFAQAYGLSFLIIMLFGRTIFPRVFYFSLVFIFGLTFFSIGSRGPVVALLVSVFYYLLKNSSFRTLLITMCVAGALIMLLFSFSNSYLFETNFYSIYHRFDFNSQAISTVFLNNLDGLLFGYGIGGAGVVILGRDIEFYPHNLFIEVLLEYGLLGLALFLFAVITVLRQKNDMLISICFIYALCFSMFSGDLVSNSLVFVFLSILLFFRNRTSIPYNWRNL